MKRGFVLFPVRTNFIIPKFFAIFVRQFIINLEIYDQNKDSCSLLFVHSLRS